MAGSRSPRRSFLGVLLALVLGASAAVPPGTAAADVTVSNLSAVTSTPASTLNLRSCAATTCSVLRRVPHGTVLWMTATRGDWFRTAYGGATGWVSSRYVVLRGTPATPVGRGNTARRMVSYTFDTGADLGYTAQILTFLRNNRIRASFGMTGRWAAANPTYVQRVSAEGHHVMNHTWSHESFTGLSTGKSPLSPARRTEQLVAGNNKLLALTGRSTKPYFRPPYGDYDSGVLRDVGANGYSRSIMWSVDSLGWKGLTAAQICTRVVGAMDRDARRGNGYIILFHVGAASQDANALSCITSRLRARGFTFGSVPQVLAP